MSVRNPAAECIDTNAGFSWSSEAAIDFVFGVIALAN
jgi:hypothetical protein